MKKVSVRSLLTIPGEEKNGFNSITSIFGHSLTYLEEDLASEHQEGPQGPPSTWALLTILQGKITKTSLHFTVGTHHSYRVGIGLKMFLYYPSFIPESFSLTHDIHHFSIK